MGNHHSTASKIFQSFFQSPKRIDIQVVGRLIEQKQVATFLQRNRQVHAVALPTGKYPYFFLLIRTCKIELGDIGPGIDFLVAQLHQFIAIGDQLVHGLVRVQLVVFLIYISQFHRFTHLKIARICLLLAGNQFE